MDTPESEATAYQLPARKIIERIDDANTEDEEAHRTLIRERSLALGVLVNKLALAHNGLGEAEVDTSELITTAARLVGELGLRGNIIFTRRASLVIPTEKIQTLPSLIQAKMEDLNLSLRDVAKRSDCSHTTVAAVMRGEASEQTTINVARELGLLEE